ncbi:iron ABC transporter substrate-binding protein [Zhihengliuella halotolerans]|uniref:iron ABC transporter substrate-binding protein n=1 Tax=Zhihengliuella halotolerans TaxID=370736 RepID=UPI000C7FA13F|nr:iron ABC transporter substrate-binding protein [Zhihengliuella halotolerans]
MKNLSKAITAASALVALAALSACGSNGSSPEADDTAVAAEPASDESLVLYSGRDEELIAPLVEQFTDETGIEVEVRYAGTPEMNALLLEEGDATPADVFLSQDAGALGSLAKADLLAELPENLASQVPAELTSSDGSWVGLTGRARVIAFDGDKLSADEVPDTVDALVEDEWKGRVGFPPGNASFQSFVTALRVLEGEDAAATWLEALAGNDPVLTEKNGPTLEMVNNGQLDLGLINHYYWYQLAAEQGAENMRAELKFLPGDAGGIVNVTGAAVLAGSGEDENALAFVEFLLADSAQTYFAEETFEYPLVPGSPAPEGLPALDELTNPELDLSDLDSLEESQSMLADAGLL